ncbi:MAG: 30S ribosomal protein S17 [Candidatus Magasanikbacteria bacterium]|nr:30S ribosomal protein S17 [Candidatus Magasanikbacteria bacterium]
MTTTQPANSTKNLRAFSGTVISAAMAKTIVVRVDRFKLHPKYQKRYKVSGKYHVHDEKNTAQVGDTVKIVACRPMSKTKRWRLAAVVQK